MRSAAPNVVAPAPFAASPVMSSAMGWAGPVVGRSVQRLFTDDFFGVLGAPVADVFLQRRHDG